MNHQCDGNGMCLVQDSLTYRYPEKTCPHNCSIIQCPNFLICGNSGPEWLLNCHGQLCLNCNMQFGPWCGGKGVLLIVENLEECPICLNNGHPGVSFPKCDHMVCINCFKRCFYPDDKFEFPEFPFQEKMEDEYLKYLDGNCNRPNWLNENTLKQIKSFDQEYDRVDEENQKAHEIEKYLKNCPLCMK